MTYVAFQGPCPVCHRDSTFDAGSYELMRHLKDLVKAQETRIAQLERDNQQMALQSISDFGQYVEWTDERNHLLARIAELEAKINQK